MLLNLLKSKIHRATVTGADLNYQGSISIAPSLCALANIVPWERVDIYNCTNGERFSTYVILGNENEITLNGAAARRVQIGDVIIVAAYASMTPDEAAIHKPTLVLVDAHNNPIAA